MIKNGIYKDLSNEEYHADPAFSRSAIMLFDDSPYKYWAHYLNPDRPVKEQTDAMIFGSAFHTFILEPHLFGDLYAVMPKKLLLRDVGREVYDANEHRIQAVKQNLGKNIILSHDNYLLLEEMQIALINHEQAWNLIQDGRNEQSYFWRDEQTEVRLKARPDILHENMIVDLKTCASASSKAFQSSMMTGGYHVQGAMIREAVRVIEGRDIETVVNICVEKTYPYEVAIKIIHPTALRRGKEFIDKALIDIKHAIVNNEWRSKEVEIVDLPGWAT